MFSRRASALSSPTIIPTEDATTTPFPEQHLPEEGCRWCGRPRITPRSPVSLYFFYDRYCDECIAVQREVLEPLRRKYGVQLVVEARDIETSVENYRLLRALEEEHGLERGALPEIFIGSDVLVGEEMIRERLAGLVEEYLARGGVGLPTVQVSSSAEPTREDRNRQPVAGARADIDFAHSIALIVVIVLFLVLAVRIKR